MSNWILYVVLIALVTLLSVPFKDGKFSIPIIRTFPSTSSSTSATAVVPQEKVTVVHKTDDSEQWGVAKKIGEHTYTIKVGEDARMATAQEVVDALNAYRHTKGKGDLVVDSKLAEYAQGRADFFKSSGTTDAHAGFSHYLDNEDGFTKLGFSRLGENSYYGGPLLGVHLIEWVFGASQEHNANQLDGGWQFVGVGINGVAANLIFGGGKF